MPKVVVYFEGGGHRADGRNRMRRGLTAFLAHVVQRERLKIIVCGATAVRDYLSGQGAEPGDRRLLLIDSEGPVVGSAAEHASRLGGKSVGRLRDEDCHFMVECMEAWLIADRKALGEHYGKGFRETALPVRVNVEQVPKAEVLASLQLAAANTTKGKYHKINHGAVLLGRVDPTVVRGRAPHCDRLLTELARADGT